MFTIALPCLVGLCTRRSLASFLPDVSADPTQGCCLVILVPSFKLFCKMQEIGIGGLLE